MRFSLSDPFTSRADIVCSGRRVLSGKREDSTYDGDDLLLDQRREGNELEDEGEVELGRTSVLLVTGNDASIYGKHGSLERTEETRRAKEMVC